MAFRGAGGQFGLLSQKSNDFPLVLGWLKAEDYWELKANLSYYLQNHVPQECKADWKGSAPQGHKQGAEGVAGLLQPNSTGRPNYEEKKQKQQKLCGEGGAQTSTEAPPLRAGKLRHASTPRRPELPVADRHTTRFPSGPARAAAARLGKLSSPRPQGQDGRSLPATASRCPAVPPQPCPARPGRRRPRHLHIWRLGSRFRDGARGSGVITQRPCTPTVKAPTRPRTCSQQEKAGPRCRGT